MSESQESPRLESPDPKPGPVRETGGWVRLPYLVLFVIVFELVKVVTYLTMLVQFILRVTVGRPNARLRQLGAALGRYLREVTGFLTYESDVIPYPFGSWPERPESNEGQAGSG